MRDLLTKNLALLFPALICASILVIVAPLPPVILDVLISANITLSVLILLSTIYVKNPLELSVFPTILLATTLARLVLNVASTRLILTGAADRGTEAAGGVIAAFGEFVAGGSAAVGFILFGVLIAIQWLVVTKGATRISEVAARFALDGMPGKQMAIDADLNAGLIDGEQAKKRRAEVTEQADFYGAMDGASKFVRGDAVAGLVITAINVIGGLYIGVFENGMSFTEAGAVFTTLTIGDGLVTQVPTFLVSIAAGLIVTRTSADSDLQTDILGQLFRHPAAMYMAATFLAAMAFTGLPMAPMLALSIGCAFLGNMLKKAQEKAAEKEAEAAKAEAERAAAEPVKKETDPNDLALSLVSIELGTQLVLLAIKEAGGDLVPSIRALRANMAKEIGVMLPPIGVSNYKIESLSDAQLGSDEYQISIRGVAVAWGQLHAHGLFALDTGHVSDEIHGIHGVDPSTGHEGIWIEKGDEELARGRGYEIYSPSLLLCTHVKNVITEYAGELLTRQQVHELVDNLKLRASELVDDVIPSVAKIGTVHQVLSLLLRERVPIRDLETILETIGDMGERIKDPTLLTEYVRAALSRLICKRFRDATRTIHAITIDPIVEDMLAGGLDYSELGLINKLSPQTQEAFNAALAPYVDDLTIKKTPRPVLICTLPRIRAGVRQITFDRFPALGVLAVTEVSRDTGIEAHGQLQLADIQAQLGSAPAVA